MRTVRNLAFTLLCAVTWALNPGRVEAKHWEECDAVSGVQGTSQGDAMGWCETWLWETCADDCMNFNTEPSINGEACDGFVFIDEQDPGHCDDGGSCGANCWIAYQVCHCWWDFPERR